MLKKDMIFCYIYKTFFSYDSTDQEFKLHAI